MPFWAVARTLPHRETFAAESIGEAGFEVFAPKVREGVGLKWRFSPLFRGYLFVRVVDRWRIVERTLGVLKFVKFGDAPARCPDAEIAALIKRSDADGIIRLPPEAPPHVRRVFSAGETVTITSGAFRGFRGLHTGMTTRDREVILLDVLGGKRPIAIASHQVAPA
jgi:transcription antitermination factor NusG